MIDIIEFVKVLKAPTFIEKLLLLIIIVVLTGVLVPIISNELSDNQFKKQKIFEAEIQRQHEILLAEENLLNTLSKVLWEFQLSNINVSFYAINKNKKAYDKSVIKYQKNTAHLLGEVRVALSTSKRLASSQIQKKLSDLYFKTLLPIDASLEVLIKEGLSTEMKKWNRQHDKSFITSQNEIDIFLTQLAIELKLATAKSLD